MREESQLFVAEKVLIMIYSPAIRLRLNGSIPSSVRSPTTWKSNSIISPCRQVRFGIGGAERNGRRMILMATSLEGTPSPLGPDDSVLIIPVSIECL